MEDPAYTYFYPADGSTPEHVIAYSSYELAKQAKNHEFRAMCLKVRNPKNAPPVEATKAEQAIRCENKEFEKNLKRILEEFLGYNSDALRQPEPPAKVAKVVEPIVYGDPTVVVKQEAIRQAKAFAQPRYAPPHPEWTKSGSNGVRAPTNHEGGAVTATHSAAVGIPPSAFYSNMTGGTSRQQQPQQPSQSGNVAARARSKTPVRSTTAPGATSRPQQSPQLGEDRQFALHGILASGYHIHAAGRAANGTMSQQAANMIAQGRQPQHQGVSSHATPQQQQQPSRALAYPSNSAEQVASMQSNAAQLTNLQRQQQMPEVPSSLSDHAAQQIRPPQSYVTQSSNGAQLSNASQQQQQQKSGGTPSYVEGIYLQSQMQHQNAIQCAGPPQRSSTPQQQMSSRGPPAHSGNAGQQGQPAQQNGMQSYNAAQDPNKTPQQYTPEGPRSYSRDGAEPRQQQKIADNTAALTQLHRAQQQALYQNAEIHNGHSQYPQHPMSAQSLQPPNTMLQQMTPSARLDMGKFHQLQRPVSARPGQSPDMLQRPTPFPNIGTGQIQQIKHSSKPGILGQQTMQPGKPHVDELFVMLNGGSNGDFMARRNSEYAQMRQAAQSPSPNSKMQQQSNGHHRNVSGGSAPSPYAQRLSNHSSPHDSKMRPSSSHSRNSSSASLHSPGLALSPNQRFQLKIQHKMVRQSPGGSPNGGQGSLSRSTSSASLQSQQARQTASHLDSPLDQHANLQSQSLGMQQCDGSQHQQSATGAGMLPNAYDQQPHSKESPCPNLAQAQELKRLISNSTDPKVRMNAWQQLGQQASPFSNSYHANGTGHTGNVQSQQNGQYRRQPGTPVPQAQYRLPLQQLASEAAARAGQQNNMSPRTNFHSTPKPSAKPASASPTPQKLSESDHPQERKGSLGPPPPITLGPKAQAQDDIPPELHQLVRDIMSLPRHKQYSDLPVRKHLKTDPRVSKWFTQSGGCLKKMRGEEEPNILLEFLGDTRLFTNKQWAYMNKWSPDDARYDWQ